MSDAEHLIENAIMALERYPCKKEMREILQEFNECGVFEKEVLL